MFCDSNKVDDKFSHTYYNSSSNNFDNNKKQRLDKSTVQRRNKDWKEIKVQRNAKK